MAYLTRANRAVSRRTRPLPPLPRARAAPSEPSQDDADSSSSQSTRSVPTGVIVVDAGMGVTSGTPAAPTEARVAAPPERATAADPVAATAASTRLATLMPVPAAAPASNPRSVQLPLPVAGGAMLYAAVGEAIAAPEPVDAAAASSQRCGRTSRNLGCTLQCRRQQIKWHCLSTTACSRARRKTWAFHLRRHGRQPFGTRRPPQRRAGAQEECPQPLLRPCSAREHGASSFGPSRQWFSLSLSIRPWTRRWERRGYPSGHQLRCAWQRRRKCASVAWEGNGELPKRSAVADASEGLGR